MPEYISMPDPCPHVSRIDLIAARFHSVEELERLCDHVVTCPEGSGSTYPLPHE